MTSVKNKSVNFTGKENQFHLVNQDVNPTFKSPRILIKKAFKNTINRKNENQFHWKRHISEEPTNLDDDEFEFEFEKVTYIPNDKAPIIEITKEIEISKLDDKQTPKRFEYGWGKTANDQMIKDDEWGKPITKHNNKWQDELISINNAELERKRLETKKMNKNLDWGKTSKGHLWGELFRNRTPKKSSSWGSRKWPENPIENRIENGWKKLISDKKVIKLEIEHPPRKVIQPTKRWGIEKLSVNPINRRFTVKRSPEYKAFEWAWGKTDNDQMDQNVGWGKSSTKHDNDWQKEYKHQIENQLKEQKSPFKKINSNVEWGKNSKGFLWGELYKNRTSKKSNDWGSRKWPTCIHVQRTFEPPNLPNVQHHHKDLSWKKLTTNQMPHKAFDWGLHKNTMDHIKDSKHQSTNQVIHHAFDWGITKITMNQVNEFDKHTESHSPHKAFDWGLQKRTIDNESKNPFVSKNDQILSNEWNKHVNNHNESAKLSSVKAIIENGKLLDDQAIKCHCICENPMNYKWRKSSYVNGWDNSQNHGWGKPSLGSGWGKQSLGSGWGKQSLGSGWVNPQTPIWKNQSQGNGWGNPQTPIWGKPSHGNGWSNPQTPIWKNQSHGNGWGKSSANQTKCLNIW